MAQQFRSRQVAGRFARLAMAMVLALAVTGCAYLSHPRANLDFEGPEAIAPAQSLLILPPELEQDRLAVRRRLERTHLIERTVLANGTATPGENEIAVETGWRGIGRPTLFPGMFETPFTTEAIETRVAEDLARFSVAGQPVDRRNGRGPYRYIASVGDGVTCVYAWQVTDATTWLSGDLQTFAIDYRFCAGDRSVEELLQRFDRIDLRPYL